MIEKFRGATVEDLQLSPALVLPTTTSTGTALQLAYERDFSILPLSDPSTRQLLGWVSIDELKSLEEQGELDFETPLSELNDKTDKAPKSPVRHFTKARAYTVITPDTRLEELESFFKEQDQLPCGVRFALVTDAARKFTLGVVTADDLQKFTQRRFPNAAAGLFASSSASPSSTTTGPSSNLPPAVPLAT
ncbi:uncharacterized protein JCM6883_006018 [Sporobolomyces salmoneus]|uniref:uncharacterized protein n=1 Tax=Sporobolomyces salmoneus TaxID=183962 RepID=UPI00317DB827